PRSRTSAARWLHCLLHPERRQQRCDEIRAFAFGAADKLAMENRRSPQAPRIEAPRLNDQLKNGGSTSFKRVFGAVSPHQRYCCWSALTSPNQVLSRYARSLCLNRLSITPNGGDCP